MPPYQCLERRLIALAYEAIEQLPIGRSSIAAQRRPPQMLYHAAPSAIRHGNDPVYCKQSRLSHIGQIGGRASMIFFGDVILVD
jgi:hypothetical protein